MSVPKHNWRLSRPTTVKCFSDSTFAISSNEMTHLRHMSKRDLESPPHHAFLGPHRYNKANEERAVKQQLGRKVLFKTQRTSHPQQNKNVHLAMKQYLSDDVPMMGTPNNNNKGTRGNVGVSKGRYSPLPQRLGSHRVLSKFIRKKTNEFNWFKVTLPHGGKFSKEYNLQTIMSFMNSTTFAPLMYSSNEKEAYFYIDNAEDAQKLSDYDKRVQTSDGYRMVIRVYPGYPNINIPDIDDAFKQKIISALAGRYNKERNILDLSSFHRDPNFSTDYFYALFRPCLMTYLLELISEHTPNLASLKLDENKLGNISSLSTIKSLLPNLKSLSLGNNKIKDMIQLENIKQLDLQELWLKGNPFCSRFQDKQNEYVSEMQSRFPKLHILDGQVLQKPISFDVENESNNFPPTQIFFSVNPEANDIAVRFLNEYFDVFDSNDRQRLLHAYHEQAVFSQSVSFQYQPSKLSVYLAENRNLLKYTDPQKRYKLLKTGKLHVVSHISGLPKTQHIKSSFTLDICLIDKAMMLVTVTGVFKEIDGKEEPLRYFNRIFVIVPMESGYCIINEQFHVTHATDAQRKQFYETQTSQVPPLNVAGPSTLSSQDMEGMAISLSQQTNMNNDWSIKCLQECSWDFKNALEAFHNCFKFGKIPPEAFIKS